MQDINTTQIFQQKKFVADKWSGEFWIAYCPDKNNNGFYIDNIRLTGAEGLGGVENVSATAAGALSYYAGDGAIRVEGVGHVTVYSVTGVEVAAADVDGTSTIAVAPDLYVVKAPAAPAAKLLVK